MSSCDTQNLHYEKYDFETFKHRFGSMFMIPVYVKRYQIRIHLIEAIFTECGIHEN